MRVYLKGVALGVVMVMAVIVVNKHYRSRRSGLDNGASRDMASPSTRAARGQGQGSPVRGHGGTSSMPIRVAPSTRSAPSPPPPDSQKSPVLQPQRRQVNLGEIESVSAVTDPVKHVDPVVTQQQQTSKKERFGFVPYRGQPRHPEKIVDDSESWLKDMSYPEWYTESVKRSKVYGKEKDFVGGGNLYDEPCPNAEKIKQDLKKEHVETFSYVETGKFLEGCKNPCWYEDTAHKRLLRCLPYFYVGGVAKCGTTDLYKRLRLHPHIMEGELKEYHWWDRLRYGAHMELKFTDSGKKNDSPLPLSEYSRIIMGNEVEDLKRDINTNGVSERLCGDGSPSYLWDPSQWTIFAGNEGCSEPKIVSGSFIKHAAPDAKIFLLFRHPTPRLFSRFLSRIPRYPPFKGATPQMFHDFVVKGVAVYKRCFKEHSIRECAYNETVYDDAVVRILEGMYSVFLEDWLRIFKREQILFIRSEDYSEDNEGHILQAFDFLDVAELSRSQMRPILSHVSSNIGQNYDSVGAMLPETIEILNEFYKPFVLRLHELIEEDRFLWKDIKVT